MKSIILPKGGGKSTELVKMAAKNWYYIVCRDAHYIQSIADRLGLNIPFPLTYQEFDEGHYFGRNMKGILVDDVDAYLEYVVKGKVPVIAFTARTHEEKQEIKPTANFFKRPNPFY